MPLAPRSRVVSLTAPLISRCLSARPDITGPGRPTFAADTMAGQVVNRVGDRQIDQAAISYNGNYKVTDGIALYSFGTANNRDAWSNG